MIKRGSSNARRGRKPASDKLVTVDANSVQHATPSKETKSKGSFKGKLSHTSPILDVSPREKITVYFATLKTTENGPAIKNNASGQPIKDVKEAKSIALQRVFSKSKSISSEAAPLDPSPHKILLNEEVKSELVETSIISQEHTNTTTTVSTCPKEPKAKTTKVKRKLIMNQSLNQDASQNHKLTEYFAVRRSVRKPKTAILEEKQKYLEEAVQSGKEDGLQIHNFPGKGRGIVASRLFRRGEFVVEYSGDLIDLTEARQREKIYAADQNTGCYMYYFQHKNQSYCVDATAESPRYGRLVNHSRAGNLMPKIIEIKDRPHLLLVARVDILPGEELLYDYGDRSRDSLKHHPWLAC